MRYLFYSEGYSEENLISAFLRSRGLPYSSDIAVPQQNSSSHYLRNCRSESNIKPALKEDSWWIKKIPIATTKLCVVADLEKIKCYSGYASDINGFVRNKLDLQHQILFVNSKPKMEFEYFDDRECIKGTVIALANMGNPARRLSMASLKHCGLIERPERDRVSALKKFCQENGGAFDKKQFSEKFFGRVFAGKGKISIATRLMERSGL